MDTVSCDIINDILPLYIDDVVSEDSRNMVSTHLSQCAYCRQQYENMKSEIVIPSGGNEKLLRYMKNEQKIKMFVVATVSAAATLTASFTGFMVYSLIKAKSRN